MNVQRVGGSNVVSVVLTSFLGAQTVELEAALQNDCCELRFCCDGYDGVNHMDFFLRAIEHGPKEITLFGSATSPDIVGRFLQAVSRNRNVKQLYLQNLVFPAAMLGMLLRASKSMTFLSILECSVAEMPGVWEDSLTNAFFQNSTLDTFYVHASDLAYLTPVVSHLGNHRTLKRLFFDGSSVAGEAFPPSVATTDVIRSLLENTSESREIACFRFRFDDDSFLPIANGAIGCQSNVGLVFGLCKFREASTALFESMFQPTSNLRKLAFNCHSVSFTKPITTMLRIILHPESRLEQLRAVGHG